LRGIQQLHPQVYAALMAERTRQLAEQHQDRTVPKSIFESFCHAFIIHSPDDNTLVELAGQKGTLIGTIRIASSSINAGQGRTGPIPRTPVASDMAASLST
jgi:hypothetical protein